MIVLACGLSKSGKTSLIEQAGLDSYGIAHVRGSALLKASKRPVDSLRAEDVPSNQKVLASLMMEILWSNKMPLVLDGHLLIETSDGPQLVPDTALDELPIVGVVVIQMAPKIVSSRRVGTALTQSADEIGDLNQIELSHARRFSRRRSIECCVVGANETSLFVENVRRFLGL